MHEAGLSYHKSEKVNPKRDEEQVQERREEIKKNWRSRIKLRSNRVVVYRQDTEPKRGARARNNDGAATP